MRGALLLCLILLPMAGCVGTDPETSAAHQAPTRAASPSSEPSPSPAGAAPDALANASRPTTTPLAWDGRLSATACVPQELHVCGRPSAPGLEDDNLLELSFPGVPRSLSATLSWTAASPLTEKLGANVFIVKSCGDGCWEGTAISDPVQGPSPLSLAMDLPTPGEDEMLAIYVFQPGLFPDPLYGYARTEQAFRLDGAVESLQ